MKIPRRVFGLDVSIDITVWILVAILFNNISSVFMAKFPDEETLPLIVASFVCSICFIFSVLAHELGHVWVGRKMGVEFSGITLFVFGGAAKMDSPIPSAKAEFLMALAGPATSILLGIICLIGMIILDPGDTVSVLGMMAGLLCSINIILGLFNLIPAFPTDGGRVLRSAIWKISKNFVLATKIAGGLGMGFGWAMVSMGAAMCFGINVPLFGTGIGSGIWIAFIGFLIQLMARAEIKHAKAQVYADELLAKLHDAGFGVTKEDEATLREMCLKGNVTIKVDKY